MHALVVGGTGMLRDVSLHLVTTHDIVTVVSRRRSLEGVESICVDWNDTKRLRAELAASVAQHGPLDLAVCWIHSDAPEAPYVVAEAMGKRDRPLYQVFGSGDSDVKAEWRRRLGAWPGITYRTVHLGRAPSGRWLDHEEISGGVLAALEAGAARYDVGS